MLHALRFRIPAVIIGLGVVSASAIGFIGWSGAEKGAVGAISDRLSLAAESQRTSLELIAERLRVDIKNISTHKQVLDNILDLSEALASSPENKAKVVEHFSSVAQAERKTLDGANSGLMYGLRHSKLHPAALSMIELGHYEDIALLDANGTVVYTTKKGIEFTKTLEELKGSGLETVFETMKGRGDKDITFQDFAATSLASTPSAFIGIPLLKKSNVAMDRAQEDVRVGYAVIRITAALIDRVMSARYGIGETGQTYAIGPDNRLRTNAPLLKEPSAGKLASAFGIDPAKADVEGGLDDAAHKRAAAKVEFMGTPWIIVAELELSEAMAGANELSRTIGLAALVILVGQFVVGFLVARGIVRPINTLTGALKIMAAGELSTEISGKSRRDEIGEIARAVEGIRGSIEADAARRAAAQEDARRAQEQERRRMTEDLAREFENQVGTVVRAVASAANDLERSAQEMASMAASSKASSGQVSSATEAANREVQSVAAASEELSASIRDVANLTNRSGAIAADADSHARETHEIVQSLSTKAEHIRSVVDMIKAIAEQTNLLALNATIEAARAGEAGKGFAVVASEVKALASQTAKATEEIASQIQAVSEEVNRAVNAVASIRGVVTSIGEAVVSINGAIEQQTAATQEIAKSASSAADETSTVASSIGTVSQAISTTDQSANKVVAQARKLGAQSGELSESLQRFIARLLAA